MNGRITLMRLTTEAHPGLVRLKQPDQGSKLAGVRIDDVSLGVGKAELTLGRSEPITEASGPDSLVATRGSVSPHGSNSPLLSAIEELQGGRLTPPSDVELLLTQAVAARRSRRGEDITAWSQRLADEAARADS